MITTRRRCTSVVMVACLSTVSGGPDSKYAVRVGNGYSGGQDLRPVSKAEAIASVREYANTSEIPSILEEIEGTEAVSK